MPALSKQQQKLFGLALAVKRGDVPKSEVSDEIKGIVDKMSEKDIEKYAKTKHKGLPNKKEDMKSFKNEMAVFNRVGKKLVNTDTGKTLKDMKHDELDRNITMFYSEGGNMFWPAGKFIVYFHQDGWKDFYDKGEAGLVMFPIKTLSNAFEVNPILDIWKKSYIKKVPKGDMIWGVMAGQKHNGNIYIDMMSVKPGYKRNSINGKMVQRLIKAFNLPIVFDQPTEDGLKFIKKYAGDKAKFSNIKYHRPKNWKELYPNMDKMVVELGVKESFKSKMESLINRIDEAWSDLQEAYAVSRNKIHKFITGKNLTYKGKKYPNLYFEVLRTDNISKIVTLRILSPKNLFGDEINVKFSTIRRGPFLKTDTSKFNEGWSDKYKRSIDCNNPKGFSQKAHCKGRKKK